MPHSSASSGQPAQLRLLSPLGALYLGLIVLLGWGLIAVAPPGSQVAAWWPAAGVSVVLALQVRRADRKWVVVAVMFATALSNIAGGRPIVIAICFGLANAAEVAVVVAVLTAARPSRPVLDSLESAFRLCVATAAGGVVVGALGGATVSIVQGGEFWSTGIGVAIAHATAIFVIASFAMAPRPVLAHASVLEHVAQGASLAGLAGFVFAVGQELPLAFLPLPLLAWAAFRFSARVVSVEILALAVGVSVMTSLGGGPFVAGGAADRPSSLLIQIFLLAAASFAVLANSTQYDRLAIANRLASQQQLLRGGFVQSRVGLMIVGATRSGLVALEHNRMAEDLLGEELATANSLDDPIAWSGELASAVRDALAAGRSQFSAELPSFRGRIAVDVLVQTLDQTASTYTVQLVDVTEARRTVEAQLVALDRERRATAKLQELNRQQDEFVASASHELRTPIASILGYAEMLTEMDDLPPDAMQSANTIYRNATRLGDLVEDILQIGTPSVTPVRDRRADVNAIVSELLESLEPVAAQAGVIVRSSVPTDEPQWVRCTPLDLARIMTNLISNGVKYSGTGGTVTVSVDARDDRVAIRVHDDGPGMTPEVLSHAFDRFYRAPDTAEKKIVGTGLGLPLVHGLVEANAGSIVLESTPGTGTTATVTLEHAVEAALAPAS
ncbi:sensor histidine kinase [Marisediminicola senii]|uniref:sensor histidine kinase n=1 Tax=Marisediminicola senii TaxID=2711233 RepID=UPI0013EC7129|nr:ATP-binding protein [Marisediminicola senii]